MDRKSTFEELKQRIRELEEAVLKSQRVEKALQESANQFRSLFEQSNDSIFLHDLNGKILDINSRTCELLGYDKKKLLTMTIFEVHPQKELPVSAKGAGGAPTISAGSICEVATPIKGSAITLKSTNAR